MAKKQAPTFSYVWTVTFTIGFVEKETTFEDLVAYDLPELNERWEAYKNKRLKGVLNPVLVKVARGKSVYV